MVILTKSKIIKKDKIKRDRTYRKIGPEPGVVAEIGWARSLGG